MKENATDLVGVEEFLKVQNKVALKQKDWLKILGIGQSTLYNHKDMSKKLKFDRFRSYIIKDIENIWEQGEYIFGDNFLDFLMKEHPAINNKKPLDVMVEHEGFHKVKSLLNSIEYGVII